MSASKNHVLQIMFAATIDIWKANFPKMSIFYSYELNCFLGNYSKEESIPRKEIIWGNIIEPVQLKLHIYKVYGSQGHVSQGCTLYSRISILLDNFWILNYIQKDFGLIVTVGAKISGIVAKLKRHTWIKTSSCSVLYWYINYT